MVNVAEHNSEIPVELHILKKNVPYTRDRELVIRKSYGEFELILTVDDQFLSMQLNQSDLEFLKTFLDDHA